MYSSEELTQEIVSAVNAEWNRAKSPLLISKLGLSGLSNEARAHLRDEKTPLKRFIKDKISDKIRIVTMPRQGGGVVPAAETTGMSDDEICARYERTREPRTDRQMPPKFFPDVWAAFRDRMPDGKIIVVSGVDRSEPELRSEVQGYEPAENEYVIESFETAITVDADKYPTAAEIRKAIVSWASKNHIPISTLMYTPSSPNSLPSTIRSVKDARANRARDVGFIEILESLSKDQLAKLAFPGDVILSVLRHYVQK
jgi:hypothetical protein